jgi:hypothetical protein
MIERLYAHQVVDQFGSGSGNYDKMIQVAAKAFATASENDQFFVAHDGDQTAIGFLAIGEMTVEIPCQPTTQGLSTRP